MSLKQILLPGSVVPSISCSVVLAGKDMVTRNWTDADMKSSYSLFFFFPMTSAVDASEINALKVRDAAKYFFNGSAIKAVPLPGPLELNGRRTFL